MSDQNLIIMRHGKSDWGRPQQVDFERPLNERGRRDVAKMARWLGQQAVAPICIKSSPAARASETARIIARALDGLPIIWDDCLYLADLSELLGIIAHPPGASWLLIGHNPGLESLVRFCDPEIERKVDFRKLLPTAAAYVIGLDTDVEHLAPGCGVLRSHQRPKMLD